MADPFKIDGPTCISFSGGRTSAYMLWRVLQSNGGLPDEAIVCFANTGLEDEATLRFVRDCSQRWSVPITWVEYRDDGYALVDFETASRNGEPFEAIIRKRNYLPNPVTRFCTVELKIRAMHKHLKALGWQAEGWDQMVGIRADEPRRVAKIRARPSPEIVAETMVMPLGTPRQSCIVICGHCGARHESSDEGEFNGTSWNERAAIREAIAAPGVAQGWKLIGWTCGDGDCGRIHDTRPDDEADYMQAVYVMTNVPTAEQERPPYCGSGHCSCIECPYGSIKGGTEE